MSANLSPVFVVGCDRSGTTLLRMMLEMHPELAIPTESMFLIDFAEHRDEFADLDDDATWLRLGHEIRGHFKVRAWRLPRLDETAWLARPRAWAGALAEPFESYAAREGKPRWGDKTPWYAFHVPRLAALFPEAKFVHLVRDGREVALSLRGVPFGPNNAWAGARFWREAVRAVEEAAAEVPVHRLRYEDLCAEPEHALRELCAFLDLTYDAGMLDFSGRVDERVRRTQQDWFALLASGRPTVRPPRWPEALTRREQRDFEAEAGADLARYGYTCRHPGAPAPAGLRRATLIAQNFALRVWNLVRYHVWRERGRELPWLFRRHLARRRGRRRLASV